MLVLIVLSCYLSCVMTCLRLTAISVSVWFLFLWTFEVSWYYPSKIVSTIFTKADCWRFLTLILSILLIYCALVSCWYCTIYNLDNLLKKSRKWNLTMKLLKCSVRISRNVVTFLVLAAKFLTFSNETPRFSLSFFFMKADSILNGICLSNNPSNSVCSLLTLLYLSWRKADSISLFFLLVNSL